MVGTSAGATVAAQLLSSVPLGTRCTARQLEDPALSQERAMELDIEALTAIFTELADAGSAAERTAVLVNVGALALAATTPPEAERLAIVASRLPDTAWPERPLVVTAVAASTGEFVTFDRNSGVPLATAVAASCAVPGVWPPVTIGAERFIDGGARSPTSLDLAIGHDRVLVVAPMGAVGPLFDDELTLLEGSGAAVSVVRPDEASVAAFGRNPLDPATREPSARAGRAQGAALAVEIGAFWSALPG